MKRGSNVLFIHVGLLISCCRKNLSAKFNSSLACSCSSLLPPTILFEFHFIIGKLNSPVISKSGTDGGNFSTLFFSLLNASASFCLLHDGDGIW